MGTSVAFLETAPIQRAIFEALIDVPHGISLNDLAWRLYQGENEPDNVGLCICQRIHTFNKNCKRFGVGFRIRGVNESGWRYRLFIVRP